MKSLIDLAEQGVIPDRLIRYGINLDRYLPCIRKETARGARAC